MNNPMAANIPDIPLWCGDISYIRLESDAMMDIDSSVGQPPSIGDVRQMVVSEPSGSNQIYSDGQPPSVNCVCRPESSQSKASCNLYEGPDENEVQQVYKMGAVGKSFDIDAYARMFLSKVSQPFGIPHMAFNSIDSTINNGGLLHVPPPQPIQRMRTYVKVYKSGSLGRSIDISAYSGYDELKQDLARRFGIEGQLEDGHRNGYKLVYVNRENDVLDVGSDPWDDFVNCLWYIKILSPQELQQKSLDRGLGENIVVPNQACSSSVVE